MQRSPGFPTALAIAACVTAPVLPAVAAGDAGAEPLDQVVVVANKDERSIRDVAATVTVLTRSDLSGQLATSIGDAFRYVPGVDYEGAGTRFGTESINIRGIGGNRVAMLVDGVPLPDQFDTGSFSDATRDFIDAGLIQGIEVLHGPASALYGSAAIGGVVAIRTPEPADIVRRGATGGDFLTTWQGVDGGLQTQAMAATGDNSLGLLAGYSRRDGSEPASAAARDNPDRRDVWRETMTIKLVADNRWGHTLRASAIHQRGRVRSDLDSMLGTGRYRSTTALEGDDRQALDVLNLAYAFGTPEGVFDDGVVRAFRERGATEQFTLDERAAARTPVSIDRFFSYDQEIQGLEINLWKNVATASVAHRLGFGAEYRERQTTEFRDGLSTDLTTGDRTNILLGEQFPLRDFPVSTSTELALYVEDTMSLGENWTVIAGVRADRFRLDPEADAMYAADYPDYDVVTLDESDLSPKVSVLVSVLPGVDVYAQYSHGFRAPPYADANVSLDIPLFMYRAIPNPELESESSDGFEIGVRWHGTRSFAGVSAFRTDYDNFIETKVNLGVDAASGYTLFQSRNIASTRIEGMEVSWATRLGAREQFAVDGSAYLARGANTATGGPLNSVGPAQAVVGLAWSSRNEAREIRFRGTFTGAYDRVDEAVGEQFKPRGYAVFDLFVTQQLGRNVVMRAGLHNLTDRTYWNWSDVRGLAPGDPLLPYLAQAGRTASVSLNLVW